MAYWVRTRHDGEKWLWRVATALEVKVAKGAGIPVHQMYPHGTEFNWEDEDE